MTQLTDSVKRELLKLIEAGQPLPGKFRGRLFLASVRRQDAWVMVEATHFLAGTGRPTRFDECRE